MPVKQHQVSLPSLNTVVLFGVDVPATAVLVGVVYVDEGHIHVAHAHLNRWPTGWSSTKYSPKGTLNVCSVTPAYGSAYWLNRRVAALEESLVSWRSNH